MNTEKLKQSIQDDRKEISRLEDRVRATKKTLAERACPYEVGDEIRHKINSERAVVCGVGFLSYGEGYALEAFKLKKDGTPYKRSFRVFSPERYERVAAL